MKPVIEYFGQSCKNCIKCLKKCPTDAISIVNYKVSIDSLKCINCDVCLNTCNERKLKATGSRMSETFKDYDYKVALVCTSILSDIHNYKDINKIMDAIKLLGFDEVVGYSDIEGMLYKESLKYCKENDGIWLTSFCPTVNRLIETQYPTLVDNLLPFDYPVEIAAKMIRERLKNQQNLGIYSICECVGKMTLAKHPFGNESSYIDHAMSISHIFPKIQKLMKDEHQFETVEISKYGVKSIVKDLYGNKDLSVISVDGLNQVKEILDLIEFDCIDHVNLISLYSCYQGCIGGYYLWANPFVGRYNVGCLLEKCEKSITTVDEKYYLKKHVIDSHNQQSMKERMEWFNAVNDVLDKLPQFDCGSCGFSNCRTLAERIVAKQATLDHCRVRGRKDEIE